MPAEFRMFTIVLLFCLALCKPCYGYCTTVQQCTHTCGDTIIGCCTDTGFLVSGLKHDINNTMINASSMFKIDNHPYMGRISNTAGHGAWIQKSPVSKQAYLEFNLGKPWVIVGIVTKGRHGASQWVTSYVVKYAVTNDDDDLDTWRVALYKTALELPPTPIFPGNHNNDSSHVNLLQQPIKAQYVRISPQTYNEYPSLRADLIGCFDK